MPHLTLNLTPLGPLLDIQVGVSQSRAEALKRESKPVPSGLKIRALIDTGASCSCVDEQVINDLGLTPTGSVPIFTPSTGTTPCNKDQYDISILISFPFASISRGFPICPVVSANLAPQGYQALIGRDLLSTSLLVYNGQEGIFTLAF